MVLRFFHSGENALEHIEREVVGMIGACRHSFDLAMSALVSDADITPVGEEVRANDREINGVEETVRRELVVHMAVTGSDDIGTVLRFLLAVKKLERVGDQAKNVFDLADEGVRFSGAEDYDRFVEFRTQVSSVFAEAISILSDVDDVDPNPMIDRCEVLMDTFDRLVNELIHSEERASYAVPRAMLFRYLKRIVANIASVVTTMTDSDGRLGDLDE
jgi:phosphate uptake regulator